MRAWIFFLLCLAGRALAAPVSTSGAYLLGLPPTASPGTEFAGPGCLEGSGTSYLIICLLFKKGLFLH